MIDIPKRFPHILQPDVPVMIRWLTIHANDIKSIDIDLPVGEGRPAPPDTPANLKAMAVHLSRRRIDLVAYFLDYIAIVEVTRIAGFTAIGQLLVYPPLYRQTFSPGLEVIPLLVCEEIQPDVKAVIADYGIKYEIV
jgi:hypothetical protein